MKIIAELGTNWDNLDGIRSAIQQVSVAGAHAIKLQIFRADKLYSAKRMPTALKMMRDYEIPYEWLPDIRQECVKYGIELWASAFDYVSLEKSSVYLDGIKIASGDMTNIDLVDQAADLATLCQIPLAIATGAATPEEIERTFLFVKTKYSPKELVMMHCVSDYPASPTDYSLGSMYMWTDLCDHLGLSDHTKTSLVGVMSVVIGATYFEKHIKPNGLIRTTPDSGEHSITTDSLAAYVNDIRMAKSALGVSGLPRSLTAAEKDERLWARRGYDGLRPTDDVHE